MHFFLSEHVYYVLLLKASIYWLFLLELHPLASSNRGGPCRPDAIFESRWVYIDQTFHIGSLTLATQWDPYGSMRCAEWGRSSAPEQPSCEGVDQTGDYAQSRLKKPTFILYMFSLGFRKYSVPRWGEQTDNVKGQDGAFHSLGDNHSQDAHQGNKASCPVCSSSSNCFRHIYPKLFEIGFYYSFTTLENFNNLYIFTLTTEIFCHWCFH